MEPMHPGTCLRRWTARDLTGWRLQALGTVVLLGTLVLMAALGCLAQGCQDQPLELRVSWPEVLLLVSVVPAHEAVHWAVARGLGYRPRLGLQFPGGWPLPYATADAILPPRHVLAFLLAPWVVLTLGMLPLLWSAEWVGRAILVGTINAAGSSGDLWMAWSVWRLAREQVPGTRIVVTESAQETAIWRVPAPFV